MKKLSKPYSSAKDGSVESSLNDKSGKSPFKE